MVPVSVIAGQVVKHIALTAVSHVLVAAREKVLSRFFRPKPPSLAEQVQSIVPQVIQKAPELLNLQQDYLDRQAARQIELGKLQLQDTRLQLEIEVEAAQAERSERLIELRQQDLADRRAYSQEYLKLLRIATKARIKAERNRIQANFDLKNWSGVLSREEALYIFESEAQAGRLLMLVPPPLVVEDDILPTAFAKSLQTEVRKGLARLFERYYGDQSLCPVSFYGGFFARFASDAEVRQQEMTFSGIPTGLISAEMTDYEVHFSLNLWGLDQPLTVELDPFDWEEFRETLLQEEGIDDRKSWRLVRQVIVSLYKLYGAFLADIYYLSVNPLHEPQLFELNLELEAVWSEKLLTQLQEIQNCCIDSYLEELHQKEKVELENQNKLEAEELKERKKQEMFNLNCQAWKSADECTLYLNENGSVYSVNITPDGEQVIVGCASKNIEAWNLKTLNLAFELSQHTDSVESIAISDNGQIMVSGSRDNTLKVWDLFNVVKVQDLSKGKFRYSLAQDRPVMALDISGDSSIIACSNGDKVIKVWEHSTRKLLHILAGHTDWVRSVSISPDNLTLVSASDDKTVRVWDLETGEVCQVCSHHRDWVLSVQISPDGRSIVSASRDKTIKIWDLETGELQRTLTGHGDSILSIDISKNSQEIVSGGRDKTIKIWDFKTGDLIHTLCGHSEAVRSVCISPDSRTIISGSDDQSIKIWRANF